MKRINETSNSLSEANTWGKIISNKPKEAWLALTGRCNLACLHCPRDAETASNESLTDSTLQKVFKDVFPYLKTVFLGGNNLAEQFISRDAERVVDEAIRQGVKVAVTTNATVVRPALIQKLVTAGAEFRLSMEGTEESWEKIRGARWETFQKFLSELEKARIRSDGGCTVTVGFTAFSDNIKCLPDVIQLAKKIRATRVHVQHLLPAHQNQQLQSLSYHRTTANRVFKNSDVLAKSLGVSLQLPNQFPVGNMEKIYQPESNVMNNGLIPCYYPWTAVNILENGDVTPCCISNAMIMGNLNKQNFESIWNGKSYQKLRARVNTNPYGACKNCSMRAGNSNNHIALLNLDESLMGIATKKLKSFLLRRCQKDTIKTLIKIRDASSRLWSSYRSDPRLIVFDIAKGVKSRLSTPNKTAQ